ncbi:hypothetical protein CWB99_17130 [Pseudoalteromonas rubra]|uniref:Uncharacterized protein n=1 Tax=Pseudoalteromonas rubra TaxID=43658 RepID=A0A5S3WJJ5_9GAMM|nr:hypothetical protein CWB99_17130 [Pseudoalteromonas rubra]TMP33795.1 hypothetical protein CWC00_09815 [Pseudoalteromonas rubra]
MLWVGVAQILGYGYKKVNGQVRKISNLTKVVVHYRQDNNGTWCINTMYPSNKGVSPVDKG